MDTTELRELAEKLPAGPWGWFGGESSFYLATKHSGRLYLMAFERRGMNGAQPVFRTGHTITPAADLAQFEVGDKSVVGFKEARKDGSVYRYDVRGFDNDVARWIAACSPDVILSLLEDLERTRSSNEAMRKALEPFAQYANSIAPERPDTGIVWGGGKLKTYLKGVEETRQWSAIDVGDFRRAREALSSPIKEKSND